MTRADLEDERRFLLHSINDLDLQFRAGEISEGDYEALRDDYTARAADVLRAIEAFDGGEAEAVEGHGDDGGYLDGDDDDGEDDDEDGEQSRGARAGRSRHSSSRKMVASVVIAGMTLVAVISVLVIVGDGGAKSSGGAAAPSAVAQKLAKAHELDSQGKAVDALKQYDEVLKDDPTNVEALTYRGWLLKRAGLADQAEDYLHRALASDPNYPDAHFFLGMLLFQDRKNPTAAIPEFERYLASNPPADTVQAVQGVLAQARQAATNEPPPTAPPS